MLQHRDFEEGARRLVSRNLGLRRGQELVVVVDEVTLAVGQLIAQGALGLNVSPTIIFAPMFQQEKLHSDNGLPLPLARAIDAASALVIAVSDSAKGTAFRLALLDQARQMSCRVALMPGVSKDMVGMLAHTDYAALEDLCEALRLPLLLGHDVTIETVDARGRTHQLMLSLGGWSLPPIMSSGLVKQQSFDNVPSGEVYVPPVKGSAHGTVVINGSVTGYAFKPGDEILIEFRDGALTSIVPADHPAAQFLDREITAARREGDLEPEYLCELGVGTNSSISSLSGNTLLDEKALGTAHIAIGINKPFGGDVESTRIHEDLIFHRPTIIVDGKSILTRGEVHIKDSDWRANYRAFQSARAGMEVSRAVEWTGADFEIEDGGLLQRIYVDGTGAKQRIPTGDNETAHLAADVMKLLENSRNAVVKDLASKLGWDYGKLNGVLAILSETYRLVQVHE